jgi:hypothetical protein
MMKINVQLPHLRNDEQDRQLFAESRGGDSPAGGDQRRRQTSWPEANRAPPHLSPPPLAFNASSASFWTLKLINV